MKNPSCYDNTQKLSHECLEEIEHLVERILDDLVDGNDMEDILDKLQAILDAVGSKEKVSDLIPM